MQAGADDFTRIIERYHRAVYAVAFSTVRDRAIADDVTQDAFVTAWRRMGELRDERKLPAWLCGIARNLARDACKRRRRDGGGDGGGAPGEPIDASTPYDALSDAEMERLIATALGQVPDVYREPLVLFYYEDRSVEDVARALGITAATTNKRLSRGRKYLAERVAIVERGLARRGPSTAIVASVLAAIAVTLPASHVDASPLKGSTMHKFAIAAVVAAALGGGTYFVAATATRGGAAPANKSAPAGGTDGAAKVAGAKAHSCDLLAVLATPAKARPRHASGSAATSLAAAGSGVAANEPIPDCDAVGRHLMELEADVTHGPDDRPDEDRAEKCEGFYATQCESEDWTDERRACVLAAADLINAHLCANGAAPAESPPAIPPALACSVLGAHIATVTRDAGLYGDVPDMDEQISAACEVGAWSLEMRGCFATATTIDALKACIAPIVE